MPFRLLLSVSRELSGTGIVGIMFAVGLGILLIRDAGESGHRQLQRKK